MTATLFVFFFFGLKKGVKMLLHVFFMPYSTERVDDYRFPCGKSGCIYMYLCLFHCVSMSFGRNLISEASCTWETWLIIKIGLQ